MEVSHLSGRDVEILPVGADCPRGDLGSAEYRDRGARTASPCRRIRSPYPSVQGVLFYRGAAMPLAVLLLSELWIRPTQDWMNEIYPMWVRAHGVIIVTPVNWYQVSSPLKLMMDRLVCADGGNPDPTLTHGKDAKRAKEVELDGWDYPRHLKCRLFSVI